MFLAMYFSKTLSPFGEKNIELYSPETLVVTGFLTHFHLMGLRIQVIVIILVILTVSLILIILVLRNLISTVH